MGTAALLYIFIYKNRWRALFDLPDGGLLVSVLDCTYHKVTISKADSLELLC